MIAADNWRLRTEQLRTLLIVVLVAALPLSAQSVDPAFWTSDEFAAAAQHATTADPREMKLAIELYQGYLAESQASFREAKLAAAAISEQITANQHREHSDLRKQLGAVVASYSSEQTRLDGILLSDLAALLLLDVETASKVARVLEQFRAMRWNQATGAHAHPLLVWSLVFPGTSLPKEVAPVCAMYDDAVEEALAARKNLTSAPPADSLEGRIKRTLRIRRIDDAIMARSDDCAEQLAALLPRTDGLRYLSKYYSTRFPSLYHTAVDAELAKVDETELDEEKRQLLAEFYEAYWQRLKLLNSSVQQAEDGVTVLQIRSTIGEATKEEIDHAVIRLREAEAKREEQVDAFLARLQQVLKD